MLNLNNTPATVSLDGPQFERIRALLLEMRDRPDYDVLPSSSRSLSAAQLSPLVPADPNLHIVLVDVPAALDPLASEWLRVGAFPSWYQGQMQEPFTCLEFVCASGATWCVDVEKLGQALVEAKSRSSQLLVCIAAGTKLHLTLMDNATLSSAQFARAFEECFYDGAAERANCYRNIRRGEFDIEPMDLVQSYEGDIYVVAKPVRIYGKQ